MSLSFLLTFVQTQKYMLNMKQRYIQLILVALMALSVPVTAHAEQVSDAVEAEVQGIEITIGSNGALRITGAKGETVYIYNVAGLPIASIRLSSDDETLRLNLKRGGYLVKVGTVARKIAITR